MMQADEMAAEAMAAEVRRRVAGMGIYVLCFVDDYLIVGDTEELARKGGEIFEAVMAEFGLHWAPHKQRGPSRCIEFLGLLLANAPGWRGVTLSRKRLTKLTAEIEEWSELEPEDGICLAVPDRGL